MFDSPQCVRPFTQFPLFSDWGQLEWLKWLLLAILLVSVVLVLMWFLQNVRVNSRQPTKLILLTGVTAGLVVLLANAEQGFTLFLPTDTGAEAEAIVVLGRGIELGIPRVEVAVELWEAKRAPLVFVSGAGDTPRILPLLAARGIPASALDGEACSLSTPENALFSTAILQTQGIRRIVLVTDTPHLWRSFLDFRAQGFEVIPHASPIPNGIRRIDRISLVFREYLFLITSAIGEQIRGNRIPGIDSPTLRGLVQQAQQYGQARLG